MVRSTLDSPLPRIAGGLILQVEAGEGAVLTPVLAASPLRRLVGLLGRRSLGPGESLLIRPCSSVHTLGMRFAIDVVYLDRDGLVLKVVRGLRPWRWSWGGRRAYAVIEMGRGEAARTGIEPGVTLRVVP